MHFFIHIAREAPNPCLSGACGANAECQVIQGHPVCSCAFGMLGTPPNCRPECVIHQECPSNRACIAQQCQDPCIGSCGFNARCTTQNHQPICSCMEGFEGDPYASCTPRQSEYNFLFLNFKSNLIFNFYIESNFENNFHLRVLDFTNFHCFSAPFSSFISINGDRKYVGKFCKHELEFAIIDKITELSNIFLVILSTTMGKKYREFDYNF